MVVGAIIAAASSMLFPYAPAMLTQTAVDGLAPLEAETRFHNIILRRQSVAFGRRKNMPLNDVLWTRPVTIRLQCGLERTFAGIYDALDFLEYEWPLRHGERHSRAVRTCRSALNGVVPAFVARDEFMAACLEAGMPAAMAPWKPKPMRAAWTVAT